MQCIIIALPKVTDKVILWMHICMLEKTCAVLIMELSDSSKLQRLAFSQLHFQLSFYQVKCAVIAAINLRHLCMNHLPQDSMTAISQTAFSKTLTCMEFVYFNTNVTEVCSRGSNWLHWFRWWLGTEQATSHYVNQCLSTSLTHICALAGDELSRFTIVMLYGVIVLGYHGITYRLVVTGIKSLPESVACSLIM